MIAYLTILGILGVSTAARLNNISLSSFEDVVDKNDFALVAFISPSTESSRLLETEWALAATQSRHPLLTIDCALETSFCAENDIVSLPAIRLFKGKKNVDRYRGPKKASRIVPYVHRSTLPTLSTVTSTNITSFISTDEYVFIAYLGPGENRDIKPMFESLAARNHHRFTFGIASDVRLANAENVDIPSVVAYQATEGQKEIFAGRWGLKTLEAFVEKTTAPLIGELTRRNEMRYLQAGKSLVYIFAKTSEERSSYQSLLKPFAKKYKEYINFVVIDAVEYAHMAPGLGLGTGNFPALALQNPMFGQVFPYETGKNIGVGEVEAWILDIVGGGVKPWNGETGSTSKVKGRDEL